MITPLIADSSALVSLASVTDQNHKIAVRLSDQIKSANRSIIVPGEIFAETVNIVGKKVSKEMALVVGRKFIAVGAFDVVETTPNIRLVALKKFERQPKSVSFTDCLVMAFADEYETHDIFGFDETFQKEGYVRFGIDSS